MHKVKNRIYSYVTRSWITNMVREKMLLFTVLSTYTSLCTLIQSLIFLHYSELGSAHQFRASCPSVTFNTASRALRWLPLRFRFVSPFWAGSSLMPRRVAYAAEPGSSAQNFIRGFISAAARSTGPRFFVGAFIPAKLFPDAEMVALFSSPCWLSTTSCCPEYLSSRPNPSLASLNGVIFTITSSNSPDNVSYASALASPSLTTSIAFR